MVRRSISIFAILLYGLLTVPGKARAETTLNRAVVEETRNQVQLLLQNQSSRLAQVSDVLVPGDGLSTANDALAELRFNDGSLGRLGEQVVFWFIPGTRNFSLSNGTVLLLIPPGQGRTTIQTPNASAGIQGSALFVRYIEETDTTVVGALTDSDIQVTNTDGSQQYTLAGGEMAVAVGDRITDIFEFDLQTFYETSTLARDLAPPDGSDRETTETEVGVEQSSADPSSLDASEVVDPAIAAVQAEMRTALQRQQPISAENSVETPDFLRMPTESSDPASSNTRPIPAPSEIGQSQAQEAVHSEIPTGLENPINDPARTSVGEPPGRDIDEIPAGRGPNDRPGNASNNNNPGNGPDNNPGRGPDNNPGNGSDNNPGRRPDNNPGNGSDNNPGRRPDNNPGNGPDNNPGRRPDNNPGNGPDNNPGREPDNNPGNGPDNNPGREPDNNPGNGPDNNPGRGNRS